MGLFGKPFRVKSNTQLKGSDKKKLKTQLKSCFPSLTEEDLNGLLPTKEEVIASKVYTYGGESIILYIFKRDTIFFQLEKENKFFPSVYTLWKFPKMLPVLTTHAPVMSRLLNGADLMLPGVIVDDSKATKAYCDGTLEKGDSIAINLTNNLAPMAVGKAFRSSEDMYMAFKHGKAVDVLHCFGDQLWEAGTRVEPPNLGPPELPAFEEYHEPHEEPKVEDVEDGNDDKAVEAVQEKLDNVQINEEKVKEEVEKEIDPRTDAEKMDELLTNAFLQAWKTSAKKIDFPILTSNFFRLHMVPAAPPGVNLDPKKSSYKKLSKFLCQKEKAGIIKVKELTKGVESIMSVNMDHDDIQGHRVVKHRQIEEPMVEEVVLPCDKDYEPPKIVELRTVNANVSKLFGLLGLQKGAGLTGSEVREQLVKYVKENNLQDQNNKSMVNLDPVLAGVVLGKGENDVVTMKWDELNQRVNKKMGEGYSLEFPGYKPQIFKGKLEPIDLRTATRSGNKKVTLITNLETFGIDPNRFAHKCQVGVAASTSVTPSPSKKSGWEVLVQGNQITFASNLLIQEYKIPRKYVKGIENAPKSKKK